jgi:hypothetical protein
MYSEFRNLTCKLKQGHKNENHEQSQTAQSGPCVEELLYHYIVA